MRYKRYTLMEEYSGPDVITGEDVTIEMGTVLYGYCHIPPDGDVYLLFTADGVGINNNVDIAMDHGFCHAYTLDLLTSLAPMLPSNSVVTDRAAMVILGEIDSCVEAYLSIEGRISKRWLVDNSIVADFAVGTLIWQYGDTIFSVDSEITSTDTYKGLPYETRESMVKRGYLDK